MPSCCSPFRSTCSCSRSITRCRRWRDHLAERHRVGRGERAVLADLLCRRHQQVADRDPLHRQAAPGARGARRRQPDRRERDGADARMGLDGVQLEEDVSVGRAAATGSRHVLHGQRAVRDSARLVQCTTQGANAVSVQRSFRTGQMVAYTGKKSDQWTSRGGPSASIGTLALLPTPQGEIIDISNLGIFRLVGDAASKPEPLKVFGFSVPLPAVNPFLPVGPDPPVLIARPSSVAVNPDSGELAIYSRGMLTLLGPRKRRSLRAQVPKETAARSEPAGDRRLDRARRYCSAATTACWSCTTPTR